MSPLLADSLANHLGHMQWLADWTDHPTFAGVAIAAVVHVALLGAFFGIPAGVFIWAERKVSGRIQDRLGPTRVGGRFGWLQSLADGMKLVQKEDLTPRDADGFLYRLAPYIVVVASFLAFMFLPFGNGGAAIASDVGLFLMLAMLSLEVIGVILAGYCSGSKWALFGAMREAAQMISYEIPMAICGLIPIIMVGTLDLNEIVQFQGGWFINWNVFHIIGGPAFVLYFVCATASCKRAPFDLAEAESELVAGFLTEYSGMRWSFFFLAEYASMFAVSGIAAVLFLGGWNDGLGIVAGIHGAAESSDSTVLWLLGNLVGATVLILKASKLVFLQIWVRWTLPRLRIDQVMTTCLKYLIPMACSLFLAAVLYPLIMVEASSRPQTPLDAVGNRVPRRVTVGMTITTPAPAEHHAPSETDEHGHATHADDKAAHEATSGSDTHSASPDEKHAETSGPAAAADEQEGAK